LRLCIILKSPKGPII